MTDDKQLERFREAVEDKNEEAERRSEAGRQGETAPAEQAERHDAGRPPDARDERKKSSRHGQVTADNWNQ